MFNLVLHLKKNCFSNFFDILREKKGRDRLFLQFQCFLQEAMQSRPIIRRGREDDYLSLNDDVKDVTSFGFSFSPPM